MNTSDQKRGALYDYLTQVFPERKEPAGMVMTHFVDQVTEAITDVEMSYGFIACQTKLYFNKNWIHTPKTGRVVGNSTMFVPNITHAGENTESVMSVDEELELQSFVHNPDLEIKHYKTGKLIDNMLSTFDEDGGMMSSVNFQVMGAGGAGKTLLTMCMMKDFKEMQPDLDILIINSEMSEVLMQAYFKKAPDLTGVDLLILRKHHPDTWANVFVRALNKKKWGIIVLDSFQDLVVKLQESLEMNSSKAEAWLVNLMSEMNDKCGTSFLVLNHVNKDGSAAGKSYLKHILDGMMEVRRDESDAQQRYVTFSKNRTGLDSVNMYYEILKQGDVRGAKGDVWWDKERYDRIHDQKKFVENNKLNMAEDIKRFEDSRSVMESYDADDYS